MSGEIPEVPSAEDQAEEILKGELEKLKSGEACVEGDNCPIHHRLDFEELNSDYEYGRLVNYVGDYCVITSDNPELESPSVLLRLLFGLYTADDAPDKFETCVIKVGNGCIGDLYNEDQGVRKEAIHYIHTHSEWDNFKEQHTATLIALESGLLDVSKPVSGKGE